ncbi:MAG: TetR/AcrR family transcriptional regulator [Henriciella sp.]
MARPKASPEQRAQVRRSIQSAAAELYREQGLSAISARAVATKAGVSVGTIYSYFGDLTGLMQSLWTGRIAQVEDEFRALAGQHSDPIERIEALLRAYLDFGINQAVLYRNALMFVRPTTLETPDKQSLSEFAFPTLLRAALLEGQSSGAIVEAEVDGLVQVLWSGVHGALALPVNMDRLDLRDTKNITEPMVSALLRAVVRS